jgi:hypothetical protein
VSTEQPGIAKEFQRLIKRFDEKPMTTQCRKCDNAATKATGYDGGTGLELFFYCENCEDPWIDEAEGRLIRTFKDAINLIDETRNGKKTAKQNIIRKIAEPKGLPKRGSADTAVDFLHSAPAGKWTALQPKSTGGA